jgi:hypothetical protein
MEKGITILNSAIESKSHDEIPFVMPRREMHRDLPAINTGQQGIITEIGQQTLKPYIVSGNAMCREAYTILSSRLPNATIQSISRQKVVYLYKGQIRVFSQSTLNGLVRAGIVNKDDLNMPMRLAGNAPQA